MISIEIITILIYLSIIFIIAFLSKKKVSKITENKKKVVQDQYLASKSITSTESLFSIIATEVSALTFIGIPAFAFDLDFRFIYLYFGAIVARSVLAFHYLPKFYGGKTTIYESITDNTKGRIFITSIYMVTKLLSIGVRLYSGSILLAQYFSINIYYAIIGLSLLTMIYTMIGGLKAVIRTDLIQTLVFISGGIAAHYIIPQIANQQWSDMISTGFINGKIISFEWSYLKIICIGFFGGIVFDLSTHGVDQDFAQRLLATKTLKDAQRSIIFSSFLSIFVGLLFLSIGTLLWVYHQDSPLPTGSKTDYVFALFITNNFPPIIKGLMLSGVLAATMSTLDSTINALSSCITADFFPKRKSKNISKWMKLDAFIITATLISISFLASQSEGILTLGLKIASWSGGYLLFCLTYSLFTKIRLNLNEYILGYMINLLSIYLLHILSGWPWQWNTAIGFISCFTIFKLWKK
jgi:solute:Na+ symporter, SSS family